VHAQSETHKNPVTLVNMSTPTRNSQELKDKSDRSVRRMKTFKRSLLMLGGLSKLQRRSITALIQEFWLENAKTNLDTSTTHMNKQAIGTHNDEFTDSSPLTSTDTDSDSNTEQRSQTTSITSSNLMQSAPEYSNICGETTPRRKLQQAATEYHDIQTESSETDSSKYIEVGKETRPFPHLSNRPAITKHNRFEYLEAFDTESDTDDDMSISDEIAVKEETISQLEQKIKAIEIDSHSKIEMIKDELTRSKGSQHLYESKYRESELKVNSLEDQIKALLKEQTQCKQNTEILDHIIRKHYDSVLHKLIFNIHKEEALASKNIFKRLLDDNINNITRDEYDKTRNSLLRRKDYIEKMSDTYKRSGLVPVTEIEKMEKNGGNFELHLEMVLAKLTRAYAKQLNKVSN